MRRTQQRPHESDRSKDVRERREYAIPDRIHESSTFLRCNGLSCSAYMASQHLVVVLVAYFVEERGRADDVSEDQSQIVRVERARSFEQSRDGRIDLTRIIQVVVQGVLRTIATTRVIGRKETAGGTSRHRQDGLADSVACSPESGGSARLYPAPEKVERRSLARREGFEPPTLRER